MQLDTLSNKLIVFIVDSTNIVLRYVIYADKMIAPFVVMTSLRQVNRKMEKCIDVAGDYMENDSVNESLWLFLYRSCKTLIAPRMRDMSASHNRKRMTRFQSL